MNKEPGVFPYFLLTKLFKHTGTLNIHSVLLIMLFSAFKCTVIFVRNKFTSHSKFFTLVTFFFFL
jgi:hypothetical protein